MNFELTFIYVVLEEGGSLFYFFIKYLILMPLQSGRVL